MGGESPVDTVDIEIWLLIGGYRADLEASSCFHTIRKMKCNHCYVYNAKL